MSQKSHNAFERLRGLLAEYADDDVDSVELVREVRERQYPPTVEPPMWSSPVYEHYHLTTFVVETDEMVELDLVKLDDPLSWGIVDSWCQFGGSSQTDMNSADGEIVTLSGGILARFREYIDAVIWAYQKIADIMGPIRIGRGAGIPNETLESLGWEDNIVSPRTPYDNREKTNDESWGKTDQGLFIQGAWIADPDALPDDEFHKHFCCTNAGGSYTILRGNNVDTREKFWSIPTIRGQSRSRPGAQNGVNDEK
jgi:hypothetical protein